MTTEKPLTVDLAEMTDNGRVTNLSGRPRGLAAREKYGLNWRDLTDARVVHIIIPNNLDSLTPSFFQGMFGAAFPAVKKDRGQFFKYIIFEAPPLLTPQIDQGLAALEITRDLSALN